MGATKVPRPDSGNSIRETDDPRILQVLEANDKRHAIAELIGDGRDDDRILLAARCLTILGEDAYRELVGIHSANVELHERLGMAFRDLRNPSMARQALADAAKLEPGRASAHRELASILAGDGELAAAAQEYEAARKTGGDELGYHLGMADVCAQRDETAAAMEHLDAAADLLMRASAELHHRRGHVRELENDLDGALEAYRAAATTRDDAHLWFHIGAVERRRGEFAAAEEALQRAISHQFDDVQARRELGALLEETGELTRALEQYRLAADPESDAPTHIAIGRIYRKLEQLDVAKAELQQATSLDPASSDAHAELGRIQWGRGEMEQAIESYRQAARLAPDVAEHHQQLGYLSGIAGNYIEAESELSLAIKLEPANPEYHEQLGAALAAAGRYADALRQYEVAATLCPADPSYRYHLGAMHARLGNSAAAIRLLSESIALCGSGEDGAEATSTAAVAAAAHDEFAALHERLEQWDEALLHRETAVALMPAAKTHWIGLGRLLKKLGQPMRAVEALDRAASLEPTDAAIHAELGAIHESLGQEMRGRDRALAEYRQAYQLAPTEIGYAISLARALRRASQPFAQDIGEGAKGRCDEAREILEECLGQGRDSAEARRELASVCVALGDADGALMHSRAAVASEPDNPLSHVALGRSLMAKGEKADATRELKTALALDPAAAEAYHLLARLHDEAGAVAEATACAIQAAKLDADESVYAYEAGHLCAMAGRSGEAREHLERAVTDPSAPAGWYGELGGLLESLECLDEALVAYQQAVHKAERSATENAAAPYLLRAGVVTASLKRDSEAAEQYLRAIALEPTLADAQAGLGEVLLRMRQPRAAVERYVKACELNPGKADYQAGLAAAYLELDNLAEATAALRRALDPALRSGQASDAVLAARHNQFGNVLCLLGQWDEAIEHLDGAARLAQGHPDYAHDLALVQARLGRYDLARHWLERALAAPENHEDAAKRWRVELSSICSILGQTEAALGAIGETADKADARDAEALSNTPDETPNGWLVQRQLGLVYLELARADRSARHLAAARDCRGADEGDLVTCYTLGLAYHKMGCLTEALEQETTAVQRAPYSAAIHTAIGAIRRAQLSQIGENVTGAKEYGLALESMTRALDFDPEFAPGHSELGLLVELSGNLAAALDSHLKAVELQPGSARCRAAAADLYLKMGRLDEARALVDEGLRLDTNSWSDSALLVNQLGVVAEASEELALALDYFQRAAALAPFDGNYSINIGRAHLRLDASSLAGNNELAAAALAWEKAIELRPWDIACRRRLALLREQMGEWIQAASEYRGILALEASNGDAMLGLGRTLTQTGDFDEASAHLLRAVAVSPRAAVFDQLSVLRRLQGNGREALRYSRQALRREPENHAYQLNLALAQRATGQAKEAEEAIVRIAAEAPDLAPAHFHLGAYFEQRSETRSALQEYLRAIVLDSRERAFYKATARAYRTLGQIEEARAALDRAPEGATRDPEVAMELSRIEQARGNSDAAWHYFRRAIALEDRPAFHAEMAQALREQRRYEDALAELRIAASAQPREPRWQNDLGQIAEEQGKLDEAIGLYNQALRLDPDNAEVHRNLGVALKKLGRLEEAIAALQRALEIKPDYADAYRHLSAASASQLLRKHLRKR